MYCIWQIFYSIHNNFELWCDHIEQKAAVNSNQNMKWRFFFSQLIAIFVDVNDYKVMMWFGVKLELTWLPNTPMLQADDTWSGPNQTAATRAGSDKIQTYSDCRFFFFEKKKREEKISIIFFFCYFYCCDVMVMVVT